MKKVKGLKNMCEGPVEMDNGVGNVCGNGVGGGGRLGGEGQREKIGTIVTA